MRIFAVFRYKDLRKKIIFILFCFFVFRILANIPIPGIEKEKVSAFFEKNQFFGFLNLFTGGALRNFSIGMLGLGPYITAIIILQLLTFIVPSLERLYKEEGEEGRRKFNQYGRILSFPIASLQAFGMLNFLKREGIFLSSSFLDISSAVLSVAAGSVFLMWLGELISEKGLGNGISLLIFAGIVARTPFYFYQLIKTFTFQKLPSLILFFLLAIFITFGVVLVTEAKRNIPVNYAKRVRGRKIFGGVKTFLPVPLNPAGVIPIIFAISVLIAPSMIGSFFAHSKNPLLKKISDISLNFSQNLFWYSFLYFILVFFFTYFYTAVTFDPKAIAENLQKMGAFIPGVRPGKETENYLSRVLTRILVFGGAFLGLIAISPSFVQKFTGITVFSFLVGGTSLLIIVGVVLETWKILETELQMRGYEK